MTSGPLYRLACLVLVLLVSIAAIQTAGASIRIVFRYLVVSWDNPATQLFDELVCESSPPSHAGAEARRSTHLAASVATHLAPAYPLVIVACSPLSSGITRAPPTA